MQQKELAKLVNSRTFRCYYTNDIIGVQLGGVIKNILAIASGIVESHPHMIWISQKTLLTIEN